MPLKQSEKIKIQIVELFPKFLSYLEINSFSTINDNLYILMDDLTSYILILLYNNDNTIVVKFLKFINQICDTQDDKIFELLSVTAFEVLCIYDKTIALSKKYLEDEALNQFEKVLEGPIYKNNVPLKWEDYKPVNG